jgi:hypothetical protein
MSTATLERPVEHHERNATLLGGIRPKAFDPGARRFANCNLPHHADKTRLILPARRPPAAVNFMNRNGVDVTGWAELDIDAFHHIENRKKLEIFRAPPNNDFGRMEIGNAVSWRRDSSICIDEGYLHQDLTGRPRGLNFPVVLLEGADGVVAVIQYHAIREKLDKAENAEARRIVIAYALKLAKMGLPVVVISDTNDAQAWLEFQQAGFDIGARNNVDLLASLNFTWVGEAKVSKVRFSDHAVCRRRGKSGLKVAAPRRLPNP